MIYQGDDDEPSGISDSEQRQRRSGRAQSREGWGMTGMPARLGTPPADYADWLADLKTRIHAAQQRAALAVNRELVLLYWQIGRDILARQAEQGWAPRSSTGWRPTCARLSRT